MVAILTKREKECLHWIAAGKNAVEIAVILGISTYTVRDHIKAIHQKLDCHTRAQAVSKAYQMKHLASVIIFFVLIASASAESLTRVWGLYGYGDNWHGTSRGIDEIAEQARTIPNVEFVHVFNYWQTADVANEILASPPNTKIAIFGYSCGANSMTTIADGLNGQRNIDTLAGIQQSLWCGGEALGGNVTYGQMTYGGCGQTLGLGCKKLMANQSFNGTILNIRRPDLHSQADNDPDAQQDVLDAIYETAAPPPPEEWHHYGHGHALARQGLATMLRGAILFKRGVHEIMCYHDQSCEVEDTSE